jgi:hypothetical protein
MEDTCTYVSSRGILKSCKARQAKIFTGNTHIEDTLFDTIQDGESVYICTHGIPHFVMNFLPRLKKRITLVSGDSDDVVYTIHTDVCQALLNSPYILQWYTQNCLASHPKLFHLPIGMDYHTLGEKDYEPWGKHASPADQDAAIQLLAANARPFYERERKGYSTFHFHLGRGDRREAFHFLPKDLVYYEPNPILRAESHLKQTNYAFVISPYGGGPDCHRTWEALALGCIPIIKSSGLDPLFKDLPVLLVKQWSDVTQDLLDRTIEEFKTKSFMYEKLTLSYWMNRIHQINA